MDEMQKRCPECNSLCRENDTYCKKCGKSFVTRSAKPEIEEFCDPDETINDIPVYEIRQKLEKNANRYLKKFKENENARIFGSFNLAAALFSIHWFFYRRMYKIGIIVLLICIAVSFTAFTAGAVIYKGALYATLENKEEYQEAKAYVEDFYINRVDILNEYYYDKIKNPYDDDIPEEYAEYLKAQKIVNVYEAEERKVVGKILAIPVLATCAYYIGVGIFADCIYRNSLLSKKKENSGGVSVGSVFLAFPVSRGIEILSGVIFAIILIFI